MLARVSSTWDLISLWHLVRANELTASTGEVSGRMDAPDPVVLLVAGWALGKMALDG